MRTTVDIPDPVYRRLKTEAAQRGCSVKELVLRGVKAELEGGKPARKAQAVSAADYRLEAARLAAPDQPRDQ